MIYLTSWGLAERGLLLVCKIYWPLPLAQARQTFHHNKVSRPGLKPGGAFAPSEFTGLFPVVLRGVYPGPRKTLQKTFAMHNKANFTTDAKVDGAYTNDSYNLDLVLV